MKYSHQIGRLELAVISNAPKDQRELQMEINAFCTEQLLPMLEPVFNSISADPNEVIEIRKLELELPKVPLKIWRETLKKELCQQLELKLTEVLLRQPLDNYRRQSLTGSHFENWLRFLLSGRLQSLDARADQRDRLRHVLESIAADRIAFRSFRDVIQTSSTALSRLCMQHDADFLVSLLNACSGKDHQHLPVQFRGLLRFFGQAPLSDRLEEALGGMIWSREQKDHRIWQLYFAFAFKSNVIGDYSLPRFVMDLIRYWIPDATVAADIAGEFVRALKKVPDRRAAGMLAISVEQFERELRKLLDQSEEVDPKLQSRTQNRNTEPIDFRPEKIKTKHRKSSTVPPVKEMDRQKETALKIGKASTSRSTEAQGRGETPRRSRTKAKDYDGSGRRKERIKKENEKVQDAEFSERSKEQNRLPGREVEMPKRQEDSRSDIFEAFWASTGSEETFGKHYGNKSRAASLLSGLADHSKTNSAAREQLYVENAGVVILHPYLRTCFENLDLMEDGQFIHTDAQHRAAHLIQFMANGAERCDEYEMLLPKFLCGIDPEKPIEKEISLSEKEKEEVECMLKAAIDHWTAIGNATPESLRETFFKREGKLEKTQKGWTLSVEQKTLDILLDRLPWGLSIVNLPWLEHLLFVQWV